METFFQPNTAKQFDAVSSKTKKLIDQDMICFINLLSDPICHKMTRRRMC